MSRRTALSRPWLSSWPVADWKRRLNSSSLAFLSSATSCSSSSPSRSLGERPLVPMAIRHLPHGRRNGSSWAAVLRAAHGLARELLGDTRELEHHAARLDVRDPP